MLDNRILCLFVKLCRQIVPDTVNQFPEATIAGSKVVLVYLKGLTNSDFTQKPVKGGNKIDQGKGDYFDLPFALWAG